MAFLIAPLWVPLSAVLSATGKAFDGSSQVISIETYEVATIAAIVGYSGALLLGLPVFLLLRSRRMTAFYMAPLAGFLIAILAMELFGFALSIVLGATLERALLSVLEPPYSLYSLTLSVKPGLVGALVGSTLWLICRPDQV